MGLMQAIKGLFGGGAGPADSEGGEPVSYGDYTIRPAPERTANGWNTAGTISRAFGDQVRVHHFIRVDSHATREDAMTFSVTKAQQIIDQLGERLFDERS